MARWLFDVWMVLPDWAVWTLLIAFAVAWILFVLVFFAWAERCDDLPADPGGSNVVLFPAPRRPYDWATDPDLAS